MRRMRKTAVAVALFAAIAVAVAQAAAASPPGTHTLGVQLGEWNIVPSQGLVSAGTVRLRVENFGRLPHELVIVPTVSWDEQLRVAHGHALGRGVAPAVVVPPGQTRSAHVRLAPGYYMLVDNLRGHYALGTAIPIVVG